MEENESPNDLKKTASSEDSAYNSSTNDEGKPQIKVDSAISTEATNDHKMQEMKQLEREPQKVSIIEENKEKDSEGQEDNEQTDKSQYPNQENQESHQPDDSEESDREDSSSHQVEEASEEDSEDIEVKANHDHGSVSNSDSDDYDPENTYEESPEPANITKNNEVEGNESNESSSSNESNESSKSNESAESDDYDPEVSLANPEDTKSTNAPTRLPPAGLPPKPPVNANKNTSKNSEAQGVLQNQQQLKKAYDALMHSEAIKNPDFVKLPQPEQMRLVLEELKKNNVSLSSTINPNINYDQVYSYNKPFKNLKNPIPLIPINEYSKRPNITLPMSHIEEEAYEEFINTEAHYMKLQVWDEFPDNSRLFIGNLPANTVSKQDLFRIFSQYGEVVQISIKAGYGFVQFRTSEACLEAIKGESGVPLHNKIMRLDASRPQKSKKQPKSEIVDTNFVSRGRERPSVESIRSTSEPESKKPKTVADCKILTTGSSSIFFIRQVKKVFSSHNISYTTEDVTHTNTSDAISDAAYSGVLATCIIKEMRVDLQTFESTSDGGIKFDEYSDIDPASAAEVVEKAQRKRYGNNKRQKQVPSLAISYQDDPLPQGGSNNVDQYGRRRNDRRGNSIGDRRNGGSSNSRIKQQYQNWDFSNQQSPHPFPSVPPQPVPQVIPQIPQVQNQIPTQLGSATASPYSHPTQFNNYASPPIYGMNPPVTAPQGFSPVAVNQANLLQSLQNLDPGSMQNVINLLQQQQHQRQQQDQQRQQHQNQQFHQSMYGQPYSPYNQGQLGNVPNNQVNNLLSQLQNSQAVVHPSPPQGSQQQSDNLGNASSEDTTSALMDTLARLSRK